MRSADIKIGETYAIGTTSRSRHRRSAPRPGVVKAVNVKRRKTTGYGYVGDGVIVDVERYGTLVQEIVMPAQVRMTWDEYEAEKLRFSEAEQKQKAEKKQRDAKRSANLEVLVDALANVLPDHTAVHPEGGFRFTHAEIAKLLGVDLPYPEV